MNRGRQFKTTGSLIATAIGAMAATYWVEAEFSKPKPEKPRLSDPDSDKLYSITLDEDAPATQSDGRSASEAVADLTDPGNEKQRTGKSKPPELTAEPKAGQSAISPDLGEVASSPPAAPLMAEATVTPDIRSGLEGIAMAPAPKLAEAAPPSLEHTARAGTDLVQGGPSVSTLPKSNAPDAFEPAEAAPVPGTDEAPTASPAPPENLTPTEQIRTAGPAAPSQQMALQPDTKKKGGQDTAGVQIPAPGSRAEKPDRVRVTLPVQRQSAVAQPAETPVRGYSPTSTASARPDVKAPPPTSLAEIRARLPAPKQIAATQRAAPPERGALPKSDAPGAGGVKALPPTSLAEIRARLPVAKQVVAAQSPTTLADRPPVPSYPPAAANADIARAAPVESSKEDSRALPVQPLANDRESELLALAPVVNGAAVNRIITVERASDGGFSARAEDLRALRIKLDPLIKDGDSVAFSTLPGLKARYVEATQSIELNIPDAFLTPTEIDARPSRAPIDVSKIATTSGLLLNYRLFGTAQSGDGRAVQLTGDTEVVGMTPLGLFVTNGFFSSTGHRTFVRGDSFWRYEDLANVRTYTAGDLQSGAVSWSRSVRLGGIQIQSDFQQRPDLFTGPLPQFAGSAALPSSLDLFVDGLQVFSTKVPQGPFVLRSLPTISGNELRIVTTDVNGRQTEITTPFFNAPGLLRKGLVEYSAELGAPRIDAGIRSFGYRSLLFGSGTLRYGLSDRLTVEAHVEAGGDLVNGGFGIIQALGPLGSVTASGSVSNFRGAEGARFSTQYRFDQKRFSLFANIEREYGDYFDLGDISSFRGRVIDPTGADLFPRRQKRAIERFGATFRPAFDPLSVNLGYTHLRLGNGEIRTANVALRRRLTDRVSFTGNAIFNLKDKGDVAVSAGLNIRLGGNIRAFAGGDRSNGRTSYNLSATGFSGGRQNALGYSIAQRGNDDGEAFRSASLNYRLPQAFVAGSIDQSGNDVRGALQLEGSVVAAGNDVFVANRIGEGFAIIKNAGPGVDILQSGRKIATANGKGRALLSSLEAFSETRVAIDPATLPTGLEAENGTDFRVVTARRRAVLVDFGVRKVNAAIVVIRGPDGKPIPPGTRIDLGGGEPGLMGYDGEVFLKDLKARNSVSIDLGPAGKCAAVFSYDVDGEPQPLIGPITCS